MRHKRRGNVPPLFVLMALSRICFPIRYHDKSRLSIFESMGGGKQITWAMHPRIGSNRSADTANEVESYMSCFC